mmetsp:Transcript_47150/g.109006  ORF Transcript_47150/g.109006 Transcript_47150/m.109006 type:complete len:273 (-) Transcript_47150:114-932(-)|eukprot:CAMPEP_0171100700 /NCGR_PEP_ID=MMETSP0766_2-20121228/53114_1 /TAXON_ID=439317 /ORGANISM="Gambierdiscus australes, Strain CAWD 149" /LENGTH=272 /DNA_ID=CAMNT_0011560571 /DNA_START=60 /DNA_END=878 /DNA_ORIENTATION=-
MAALSTAAGVVALLSFSSCVSLKLDKGEHQSDLPEEFNSSRLAILASLQSSSTPPDAQYNCDRYPHMCKAPFDCQSWTAQDTLDVRLHGLATEDGHANLRTWCMPGLERYASTVLKECITHRNLKRSAQITMERTVGDFDDELDASYCFAEGHCTNQVVSDNTTLDDMEKMCDWRFTHRGWTMNFAKSMKRLFGMPTAFSGLVSMKTGFHTQRLTRTLSKMACAQGIFHCDVQYCKHTYCRDEYYVHKYGYLLPPIPGNLIQDFDHKKNDIE